MYSHFKINGLVAHYITSSPTSTNGDVMFYIQKTKGDPMVNWTSTSFLPYVMSDSSSCLGPQWTNQSTAFKGPNTWYKCDLITDDAEDDSCPGDLFLFSKTSSTDSPGYVLLDYEIEFRGLQLSVKNTLYPVSRANWSQVNFAIGSTAVTAGNSMANLGVNVSNNIAGTQGMPTGAALGDIYKIFFDVTNSVVGNWTGVNAGTLAKVTQPSLSGRNITLTDGFTCYGLCCSATAGNFALFTTLEGAMSGAADTIVYQTTTTIAIGLQAWISLVGQFYGTLTQSAI